MKDKKKETRMIIITPQHLRRLREELGERMRVRRRKEQERREQYNK